MGLLTERSEHRPMGIFDVRDHYREQQVADGLAATVSGRVRFAVTAVVTPGGRAEPPDWVLDTRPTLSGSGRSSTVWSREDHREWSASWLPRRPVSKSGSRARGSSRRT